MIVAMVILLLIVLIVVLLLINKGSKISDDVFVPQVYDAENIDANAVAGQDILDDKSIEVMSIARNFTARYLSYSNQNVGDNIAILEGQMTRSMIKDAETDLDNTKSSHPIYEFYGVSAKVLSQHVVTSDGEEYVLLLSLQLQETLGSREEVSYVEYEIEMIDVGGDWLVNSLSLKE